MVLAAYYDVYCRGVACAGMELELVKHVQQLLRFPAAAMQLLFCFIDPPPNLLTPSQPRTAPLLQPPQGDPYSDPDFT